MRRCAPLLFLLLLLLPLSGAWASCRTEGYTVLSEKVSYPDPFCGDPYELFISQCIGGNGTYTAGGYYYANCDYRFEQWASYGATCFNKNYHNTVIINHNCPTGTSGNISSSYDKKYYCRLRCNSQLSADSAVCVRGGNQWINGQCVDVCESEKAECDRYGGIWQLGNTSDGSCNGNCNICGGDRYKESIKELRLSCCESGWGVNELEPCYNVQPPWIGYNQSGFLTAWTACNYGKQAQFDSWCLENAGDDTTQASSSSQTPDCFGSGCPSSSSMSSSSGTGGGEGGSSSSESGGGEGGSSSSESGGGEGGSSGEESSSSESGGGGQGGNGKDTVYIGNGEDWEYNYYPELDSLIKYLKGVFGLSLQLGDKIDEATAELGSKIVQWQPGKLDSIISELKAIKSLAGQGTGGDSSGGYWDGDSAISALWDSLAQFGDTSGFGSLFGTADGDSALDSLQRFLDGNDSLYGSLGGQLDSLGGVIGDAIRGLADSGAVGAFRDSLQGMADKFDYKRFTGSGGCPAFLTQKTTIDFGQFSVEIPAVGELLCTTKISIFGRTPWEFGRALIRAIVAISCMLWLFKVATGATGGDDD